MALLGLTTAQAATVDFDAEVTELVGGIFRFDYTINLQTDSDVQLITLRTSRTDLLLSNLTAPASTVAGYDAVAGLFRLFPTVAGTSIPAGTVLTGFGFETRVRPGASAFSVTMIDGNVISGTAIAPVPLPLPVALLGSALIATAVAIARNALKFDKM